MLTEKSFSNAAIVGGGPAGLATALMLAKRGWTKITVLEKRPAANYYEPDKSYNYLIDGRGQKFTDLLGLSERLSQIGVSSKEFYLTRIKANGKRKTIKVPFVNPTRKEAYWVPRQAFLLLLYQEIEQNWQERITVLFDTQCDRIDKKAGKLTITASGQNGRQFTLTPRLLVGCDGINSIVRNTLEQWEPELERFKLHFLPSPSSGLKYKVLSLPPQFPLDRTGESLALFDMAYAIRGSFKDRQHSISLGLFPIKDSKGLRSANLITLPQHQLWELKSSEQLYDYFERAFPYLPVRQIVSPQEAERFAKSDGGSFPMPQYCSGLSFLLERSQTEETASGVVLIGDAIHCFPPDIGQGVNSALEDVCVFNEALTQTNDDLDRALPLYESLRSPDVKALTRLAQTAFPWQYNQDRLGRGLWSINFFLRLVLNRIFPFIFNPPSFFLLQNHSLSYQQIWRKAQQTTRIIYFLILAIASILLGLILKEFQF
jgi:2-polyprenyl-6-methoxyphenol hydroxylase-like FAD-dependent oxidoreductase